jgi:peptide deformylase
LENRILTYPDPRLLTKCVTCTKDPDAVLKALETTLRDENTGDYIGLGLASNQIGILKRVCIVRYKGAKLDLVNPVIRIPTERSSCRVETEIEGCLSLPNHEVAVQRYNQIILSADNYAGHIHFSGLWARIIQHEVDHLNGLLIIDHALVGRNSPCPCGSGKKYKKCCGANK